MKKVANKVGIIGLAIVFLLACVSCSTAVLPPVEGSISVSSLPSGAHVTIEGSNWIGCETPCRTPDLQPGTYTIKLSLEGCHDWSTNVQVMGGETSYVDATLICPAPTPTTGSISVTSSPSGADVYLNSKYGRTPHTFTVSPDRWYTIKVTLTGYEDWSTSEKVNPGETRRVDARLTRTSGYISVTSSPSGARIYLDGSYKGTTPHTISDVSRGWHRIKLSLSGYQSRSKDVMVYADSTAYVDEILEPIAPPGYISVSSSPSNAYIDLDGDYTGSITPKTLSSVSPGTHTIRLRHTDYYDWTTTVDVVSGRTSSVSVALTPISSPTLGSISVSSSPSGAYIKSLDGIGYSGVLKTPCTVPNVKPGTHVIELSLPGYEDWSTSVQVNPGETSSVSTTLVPKTTPATGTISVSSSPSSANVYLDNTYKGITPLTIPDISTGTHTIKVTLAGYDDWSQNVQVTSGETLPVPASLTKTSTPTPTPKAPTTVLGVIAALVISGIIAGIKRRERK
uniref:PEGA domain-containing protein n=1 Tax=Candidatus Methanophagaceae archaeon ANME-1 ERB6 TaxID=2759912 RepID=A0A7G9YWL0_9EURY|nr:hypothetical protein IAKEDICC_00015 [Methanosarcinales archaeon ANME-1 ERB6]